MNANRRGRHGGRAGRRGIAVRREGVLVLDRDGVSHQLRSARREDAAAVQRLLDNLSPRSSYQRFLSACPRTAPYTASLSDPERTLDAVVVTAGSEIIALGSTHPLGSGRAEIALAIADEIQGHGLGTLVLEALAGRARRRGVRRLVGDVLFGNEQMLDVLRHLGLPYTVSVDGGVAEIGIDLVDSIEFRQVVTRRKQQARQASLHDHFGHRPVPRDQGHGHGRRHGGERPAPAPARGGNTPEPKALTAAAR